MIEKLDILAFGAHPDDVELGCGGTLAKEISSGKKVGVVDLTKGELGTRGTVEVRSKESSIASKILGLKIRENLNFRDGFFKNNEEHQLKVVQVIRKYQPDVILCNALDDRHIDHPKGAKLVYDSSFLSGLSKINSTLNGKKQEPWRPKSVYHYIQWKNLNPDFVVDISGFIDLKLNAINAYESQFYNAKSTEPETLISKKNFINNVINRSADLGRLIGVDYAEGFNTQRIIGVSNLNDLK